MILQGQLKTSVKIHWCICVCSNTVEAEECPLAPFHSPETEWTAVTHLWWNSINKEQVPGYLVTALATVVTLSTDPSSSDSAGSKGKKCITERVMSACSVSMDTILSLPGRCIRSGLSMKVWGRNSKQTALTLQAEALRAPLFDRGHQLHPQTQLPVSLFGRVLPAFPRHNVTGCHGICRDITHHAWLFRKGSDL